MNGTRTDLALETVEELRSGGDISRLDGVSVAEFTRCGYGVTHVGVEGAAAARRLGKPEGQYVTVDLRPYFRREKDFFRRAAACVAAELGRLLQGMDGETVLVAGLGNRGMTADAVGPLALESLLVTRHMIRALGGPAWGGAGAGRAGPDGQGGGGAAAGRGGCRRGRGGGGH